MGIRTGFALASLALLLGLFNSPAWSEPSGDIQKIVDGCAGCHGDKGASTHEKIPIIGGMSAFYLEEQLRAYQDKARACVKVEYSSGPHKGETGDMCEAAKDLSEDRVKQVADYYSKQPFVPADQQFDAALAAEGAKIHERRCSKCHSEGGSLAFDDAGILAGQWRPYLEETFKEYRTDKRWMPDKMKPEIKPLSDSDVKALIEYYVGQGDKRFGKGAK